jgi:hypothetical protein
MTDDDQPDPIVIFDDDDPSIVLFNEADEIEGNPQ